MTFKCIRGTSPLEGYHRHLRRLFGAFSVSPHVLHKVLLRFNTRWNQNMAALYRGLPEWMSKITSYHLLDEVQRLTAILLIEKDGVSL